MEAQAQHTAQLVFQPLDGQAGHGGRHAQLARSGGDAAALGSAHQDLQVLRAAHYQFPVESELLIGKFICKVKAGHTEGRVFVVNLPFRERPAMDIARIATTRYTSKAFDPSRKIPAAQIEQLKTLLRYSRRPPTRSPGTLCWPALRPAQAKVAESTSGFYVFNAAKVQNASHVVVLCARSEMTDAIWRACWLGKQDDRFIRQRPRPARTTATPTLPICTALT